MLKFTWSPTTGLLGNISKLDIIKSGFAGGTVAEGVGDGVGVEDTMTWGCTIEALEDDEEDMPDEW